MTITSAPVTIVRPMPAKPVLSERRDATRKRLVAAALEVVAKRGFHGASVDEIAHRAGFSVGALYSNFAGKDELFLAVFDAHLDWYRSKLTEAQAAENPVQGITDWFEALTGEREQFLVFVEFWAYAVRKPKLRRQFAVRMTEMREAMAAAVSARADEAGIELALAPDELALLLAALARGLTLEKLVNPKIASEEDLARLLAQLLL
jgi:AcrR family transcriptional regulator